LRAVYSAISHDSISLYYCKKRMSFRLLIRKDGFPLHLCLRQQEDAHSDRFQQNGQSQSGHEQGDGPVVAFCQSDSCDNLSEKPGQINKRCQYEQKQQAGEAAVSAVKPEQEIESGSQIKKDQRLRQCDRNGPKQFQFYPSCFHDPFETKVVITATGRASGLWRTPPC